jgi:hypothetical protein
MNTQAVTRVAPVAAAMPVVRALVKALSSEWHADQARSDGVIVWAQIPANLLPAQRVPTATPIPRREPNAVTIPEPAPTASASVIEWSTDPDVLARVAARLRALHPRHDGPATETTLSADLTVRAPGPDRRRNDAHDPARRP